MRVPSVRKSAVQPSAPRLSLVPRTFPRRAPRSRTVEGAALGFGPHLVFDGQGCPAERLRRLDRLYGVLESLPERIHMTRIMPPYVFRHGAAGDAREGLSGFVLIAESHISIHTFPAIGRVHADVFSCEPFDAELVRTALDDAFAPVNAEWKVFDRGREFPKAVAGSRAEVARDRAAVARALGLEVSR